VVSVVQKFVTIHGINNAKLINVQLARIIHRYKNTNEKLLKANATIWFNKMCRLNHLTPEHVRIKVNGNDNILTCNNLQC
jgi:hypothetical protein